MSEKGTKTLLEIIEKEQKSLNIIGKHRNIYGQKGDKNHCWE